MPRAKDQAEICNVPSLMRGAPRICGCLWSEGTTKVRVSSKAYKVVSVNYTVGMKIRKLVPDHPYKHMAASFG